MEALNRPTPSAGLAPWIEWGVASRAMSGEATSGDVSVVTPYPDGTLVAVIDGLGHGANAAEAADAARAALAREPSDSVIGHVKRCHDALGGTRGVAMSLASIDLRRAAITWISVGNVEGLIVQVAPDGQIMRSRLITRGGVVGSALPHLRAEVIPVVPGDLLIFATDGVDQSFGDAFARDRRPAAEIAETMLANFGKKSDDAMVLVARMVGRA